LDLVIKPSSGLPFGPASLLPLLLAQLIADMFDDGVQGHNPMLKTVNRIPHINLS